MNHVREGVDLNIKNAVEVPKTGIYNYIRFIKNLSGEMRK